MLLSLKFFLLYLSIPFYHAFYVSVTDLTYQQNTGALLVEVKIFTDDLEDALRNDTNKMYRLEDGIDAAEGKQIQQYLQKKISLHINEGKPVLEMKTCTLEGDTVLCSFAGVLHKAPGSLEIRNALLFEIFPKQSNIIRLKGDVWKGLIKLDRQQESSKLKF